MFLCESHSAVGITGTPVARKKLMTETLILVVFFPRKDLEVAPELYVSEFHVSKSFDGQILQNSWRTRFQPFVLLLFSHRFNVDPCGKNSIAHVSATNKDRGIQQLL